jgi:hypothetical protein
MKRSLLCAFILLFAVSSFALFPSVGAAQPKEHRVDAISGGAEASGLAPRVADISQLKGSPSIDLGAAVFIPGTGFLAYNFDDNATETGYIFIPPDPIGAAGTDRVISVVNVGIECHSKTGTLIFRDALKDFFSALGAQTLGTWTFDPKIVYDHYENRFVVVTLERTFLANGDPADDSRILVAVSKTSTPATPTSLDWWYMAINSKTNIGGNWYWADYPGFEVDEEAVYITNNMFPFSAGNYGVRLWIIDKGVASGGFYSGGAASWNIYNPIPVGFYGMTTMPALVFGPGGVGGVGSTIGTFLVGYSSLTNGGPGGTELVQIIRVDNPLSSPTFTGQLVDVGDLEDVGGIYGFPNIPDAPQSGSASLIEVNDARALDAVWRNNNLWVTTTINPNTANDPINTGEATAHWFRFNTSAVPAPITVADQGNIGGEDIASDTWTFFPAVAVNGVGDAVFGFSASASSIYCGAYYAGRAPSDALGTVQTAGTVKAGVDYYLRTFGAGRNRWGDYSGAAVDPSDDFTFWIYNEYAEQRGTGSPPEDGRWGTAWMSCANPTTGEDFGDAPDGPYPTLLASIGARHTIVQNVFMGGLIDAEPNGIPHPNAVGDDLNNQPDEDGVTFVTSLVQGQPAQVDVVVSVPGWLDVWFDFNLNGSWLDPGERVYSGAVAAGLNPINFNVPAAAVPGITFARFRYNTGGALPVTGPAPDGEVEDYEVAVEEAEPDMDFGDAPDGPYPTLLGSNGAHHVIVPNIFMGFLIDAEPDGQPHSSAKGDDTSNLADEDGVGFVTPFVPGVGATVNVTTSVPGFLDVWFDFNMNGSWADPGELVFTGPAPGGMFPVPIPVPTSAVSGLTFARFRFNTAGPLAVDGWAPDGEVEDYEVHIEHLDFGDAPDPTYPTLLANDGARHGFFANIYMGALIDAEADGQPDPNATGDDLSNQPDEDGVVLTSTLNPVNTATVDVTVSVAGFLDAWIDFDLSGTWDPSEQIFASVPVAPGVNSLVFNVPGTGSSAFDTFARFRYSLLGALQPTGVAPEGEVEDYKVHIEDDEVTGAAGEVVPTHFALHDAVPNPFNPQTTLSFSLPSASHVRLMIYDVRGHLVTTLLDEDRSPGVYSVVWDGRDAQHRRVATGVYLYRIEAGSFIETKRMVLVK